MPGANSIRTLMLGLACTAISACATSSMNDEANAKHARNVILFIGDGMGVSTVTTMRIYAGQLEGMPGEEYILPFEAFENVALVKTYNTNQQVPDSAGTASAMHTGLKTRAGVMNVGPDARRANCAEAKANELDTFGNAAVARGKAVGIVSTARITHATPASVYAQTPERNWEAQSELSEEAIANGCEAIATQLLGYTFDVALGGGKSKFTDEALTAWQSETGGTLALTKDEMDAASSDAPLLGLFSRSHMTYELEKDAASSEPSLAEMTLAALNRLEKNSENGYYLLVEGGRIDHGHHQGRAALALAEGKAFADAVEAAVGAVDANETMILVTADHSHVFTIAGYPTRGNPILGLAIGNDASGEPSGEPILANDGHPYTTLGYYNGPGAVEGPRGAPSTDPTAPQQALVPTGNGQWTSETHAGEDVALYATGPGAGRVRGVMEQNLIYNVMIDAFGWERE
ncbi:MAG: alkaline phosphatase [Marinicaulis sp.]|nr:alkaline phosphatase [Marinicaulis sp.]